MAVTLTRLPSGLVVRSYDPVEGVQSAQLLDVSNWQGQFNWSEAAKQVPSLAGGIFRVTQGLGGAGTNSPDPEAVSNHAGIRDVGLDRGSYHFLDPYLPGDRQAEYYLGELERLGITSKDILSCDNETAGSSPTQVADCAGLFMETVAKLRPHNPRWVYSYIDFIDQGNCAGLGAYPLWLAHPGGSAPVPPPPWRNWTGWQWGTRPAGGQVVDADAFNGDIAAFDSWIASFNPPPSINPVIGLHEISVGYSHITVLFDPMAGATSYTVEARYPADNRGPQTTVYSIDVTSPGSGVRMRNLKGATTYEILCRAHPGGSVGADASIKVATK